MQHVNEPTNPDSMLLRIIDGLSYVDESTDPVAIATTTLEELQAVRAALATTPAPDEVTQLLTAAEKSISLWRGDPTVQPGSLVGLIRRLVTALAASSVGDAAEAATIVTICGSTKFKDAINAENSRLTREGNVVISLGLFGHTDLTDYNWDTDVTDLKTMLDRLHFQKIRMADRVHVVDVDGYVGESTRREIAYAESLGKEVTYLSADPGAVAALPHPDAAKRRILTGLAAEVRRVDRIGATANGDVSTEDSEFFHRHRLGTPVPSRADVAAWLEDQL